MEEKSYECFDLERTIDLIAKSVGVKQSQAKGAVELLDDGNTIPFIARYRKEATGKLDEQALRAIEDALSMYRELAQRKATILKTIDQQGKLTGELESQIKECMDKKFLEDLYLPF